MLLDKANVGRRSTAFGNFFDGSELRLVAGDVFAEGAPDALGMAGTDDGAVHELALCAVGEDVDEVEGELLEVVMNHHEVAIGALQLLFVGLDLYLAGLRLLLVHESVSRGCAFTVPQRAEVGDGAGRSRGELSTRAIDSGRC